MVPATKDVSKAFALSLPEVQKVIFIPAAVGLIRGNRKTSILNAFMYLSRIPPSRALCRYQLYNAHCSWQPELARCGFTPQAHNKTPVPRRRPASAASCEWPLLADQRLQESPSFCSELQLRLSSVGRNGTERFACQFYIIHLGCG